MPSWRTACGGTGVFLRIALSLSLLRRRGGAHIFLPGQFAVVILVQLPERVARVGDFARVDHMIVICVQNPDDRYRRVAMVSALAARAMLVPAFSFGAAGVGSRSLVLLIITGRRRRGRSHELIRRQFAVAVFIEFLQHGWRIFDFVRVDDPIVICVQCRDNRGNRRRIRGRRRGLAALISTGRIAGWWRGRRGLLVIAGAWACRRRWRLPGALRVERPSGRTECKEGYEHVFRVFGFHGYKLDFREENGSRSGMPPKNGSSFRWSHRALRVLIPAWFRSPRARSVMRPAGNAA